MNNQWVVGIGSSVIAAAIWFILTRFLNWIGKNPKPGRSLDRKILFFSVIVSTLIFVFGNILQPAVQELFEPNSVWWVIEILRENFPGLLILALFIGGFLPGIVTGLCCAKGHSFNQRIGFAAISAVVSLSALDTISFFYSRNILMESNIPELKPLTELGTYYFSLLSNLLGGPVGGLIIGSATHLFASTTTRDTPSP